MNGPDLAAMRVAALDAIGSNWTHTSDGRIIGLQDGIAAFDVAAVNPEGELTPEGQDANACFITTFQPKNALRLLDRLELAERALARIQSERGDQP